MGHYCRICGRERPNEQFSGKGHKIHVCKRCQARPKSERRAIEDKDDIFGFLEQSHISERNVARLERMAKSDNPQVASLATIVLDVARVKPYKTRRLKFLAQKHPERLGKLRDTGLILVHHWRASIPTNCCTPHCRSPFFLSRLQKPTSKGARCHNAWIVVSNYATQESARPPNGDALWDHVCGLEIKLAGE